MIELFIPKRACCKAHNTINSFIMLLLMWSCWEGLSAVALVSVQRKCSFPSSVCRLSILSKWMLNWLERSCYCSNKRFWEPWIPVSVPSRWKSGQFSECQEVQRPFLEFHVIDRRESGLTWNWTVQGLASLRMEGSRTLELDSSTGDVVQCVFSRSPSVSVRIPNRSCSAMSMV